MGALHAGHVSLIRHARRENSVCLVSIFVNPTQFGPREDLKRYPRPFRQDVEITRKEKVDILFAPTASAMYPEGFSTFVETGHLGEVLCGKSRPGHFRGVATVIAKLLNLTFPDVMYLGQKDAQQAIILKRIVADLDFPTTIKICPTVRETDGLALSSRNKYLSTQERSQAPILYRSLKLAQQLLRQGERSSPAIIRHMRSLIQRQAKCRIEYIACVRTKDLTPLRTIKGEALVALAVHFGKTRLIDNITLRSS